MELRGTSGEGRVESESVGDQHFPTSPLGSPDGVDALAGLCSRWEPGGGPVKISSFLYVYASLALSAAYNEAFLVHVALFSASLFAFVLAFASTRPVTSRFSNRLPRRGSWVSLGHSAGALRRDPFGYLVALPLLVIIVLLGPGITASEGPRAESRSSRVASPPSFPHQGSRPDWP